MMKLQIDLHGDRFIWIHECRFSLPGLLDASGKSEVDAIVTKGQQIPLTARSNLAAFLLLLLRTKGGADLEGPRGSPAASLYYFRRTMDRLHWPTDIFGHFRDPENRMEDPTLRRLIAPRAIRGERHFIVELDRGLLDPGDIAFSVNGKRASRRDLGVLEKRIERQWKDDPASHLDRQGKDDMPAENVRLVEGLERRYCEEPGDREFHVSSLKDFPDVLASVFLRHLREAVERKAGGKVVVAQGGGPAIKAMAERIAPVPRGKASGEEEIVVIGTSACHWPNRMQYGSDHVGVELARKIGAGAIAVPRAAFGEDFDRLLDDIDLVLTGVGDRHHGYIGEYLKWSCVTMNPRAVGDVNYFLVDAQGKCCETPRERTVMNPLNRNLDPARLKAIASSKAEGKKVILLAGGRRTEGSAVPVNDELKCPVLDACIRAGLANVFVLSKRLAAGLLKGPGGEG